MSILTPSISNSVSGFGFESVISSIFRNRPNLLFIDSWKEFLWSIISILLISLLIVIILFNLIFLDFNFWLLFNFDWNFNFFLFDWFYLRSNWSFSFFIFKIKLLFRVKVWRINRSFRFFLFFLLFNLFLLFFWLWSLLFRFRRCFFFSLLFDFFLFFRNNDLRLFLLDRLFMIIVQVLQSFRLLELTCHPFWNSWLVSLNCWDFWWLWFG